MGEAPRALPSDVKGLPVLAHQWTDHGERRAARLGLVARHFPAGSAAMWRRSERRILLAY
jgi:hypothetical protein